jgi:protease-4
MPKAVLLLVLLGVAASARAQTPGTLNRTILTGLDVPGSSVALEDSPAASSINPAGIGMQRGLSLRYLHEEGAGDDRLDVDGDGLYLGTPLFGFLGFGLAFEWLRFDESLVPPHRRTSWSLAVGDPRLALGVTAHVFSGDRIDDYASWDVGLLARPNRAFSLGFVVHNLDAGSLRGFRPNREYVLGVGLRPFGDWLTLAVEAAVLGSENDAVPNGFDHTAFGGTVLARVLPGVTLLGGYTHRLGDGTEAVNLGLRLDGGILRVEGAPILRTEGNDEVGWVAGATLRSWREESVGQGRTFARVRLDEVFSAPSGLVLFGGEVRDPMVDAVEGFAALGRDDAVQGVLFEIRDPLPIGLGNAWDLHRAILDLRARGKRVVAFLEGADDATYLVASAAEYVVASPASLFTVNGFSSRADFFERTLDAIGVQVESVRVGRYKSAPESLTRSSISDEQREVMNALLDDTYARFVAALAKARGMDERAVEERLARGLRDGTSAREAGWVDALAYHEELPDRLRQWAGRNVRLRDRALRPATWEHWSKAPEIAVIPITGTIVSGDSQPFGLVHTTGDRSVIRALEQAVSDASVRSILLRIDSGGGDAGASQRIWHAVREAARRKPVIAAMGDVGASGAYYAAVGADRIFATPGTYTGSIGVFWFKFNLEGLLEKLKVESHAEKRGEQADILSWRTGWTEGMRESVQATIDSFYEGFLEATAEGRNLTVSEVDAVAQGRVWTGAQAHERDLVDDLGGLAVALREARIAGGLSEDATVRFRVLAPSRSMFDIGVGARTALDGPVVSLLQAAVPVPILLWNGSGIWALSPLSWWARNPGRL